MSTDRETTRIVRSWLDEGATALPDRVLDAVLDQVPVTSQRRPLWPARRYQEMNSALRYGLAATAIVVVALAGITLLPRNGGVGGSGSGPTATPTQTSTPTPSQAVATPPVASPSAPSASNVFPPIEEAGTYTVMPFAPPNAPRVCTDPPQAGCSETIGGESLRLTLTVPDGWSGIDAAVWIEENQAPSGAALGFGRGAWLLADPCKEGATNWIPVGPTVADFVDALANHPILETTTPVDVTLAGYSGKYLDLLFPADVSTDANYNPDCPYYRPWDPGIYAQGPNHRWHLWVLDVDGVRVVVQSMDYAGTSAQHQAELQAMVDSLKIEP